VQVVVAELQDESKGQRSGRGQKPPATAPSVYGMSLSDLTDAQRKELKTENGVLVGEVQGAAARAGMRRGDVILAVNNQDVKKVDQFNQMMAQFEKGRIVALLVRRGANSLYVPFRLDAGN
jgi:serine protease Do